jgi:hypothetical protein
MGHLQAMMQAISEDVCWKQILDDLLDDRNLSEYTRQQQITYLTTRIEGASVKVEAATAAAREFALDC